MEEEGKGSRKREGIPLEPTPLPDPSVHPMKAFYSFLECIMYAMNYSWRDECDLSSSELALRIFISFYILVIFVKKLLFFCQNVAT